MTSTSPLYIPAPAVLIISVFVRIGCAECFYFLSYTRASEEKPLSVCFVTGLLIHVSFGIQLTSTGNIFCNYCSWWTWLGEQLQAGARTSEENEGRLAPIPLCQNSRHLSFAPHYLNRLNLNYTAKQSEFLPSITLCIQTRSSSFFPLKLSPLFSV